MQKIKNRTTINNTPQRTPHWYRVLTGLSVLRYYKSFFSFTNITLWFMKKKIYFYEYAIKKLVKVRSMIIRVKLRKYTCIMYNGTALRHTLKGNSMKLDVHHPLPVLDLFFTAKSDQRRECKFWGSIVNRVKQWVNKLLIYK